MKAEIFKDLPVIEHAFEKPNDSVLQKLKAGNFKSVHQTHSALILDSVNSGEQADGLFSLNRNETIAVQTADCIPLLFYAETATRKPFIMAVHSGWKGTLDGIIVNACKLLEEKNCNMSSIRVALGPSIGVCCFEVGEDLYEKFASAWPQVKRIGRNLDLKALAVSQMKAFGLKDAQIEDLKICTYCNTDYASYRRATHEKTSCARQWSWIKIKD